ncbi:ribonuclease P protein component [Allonocardiopsis opalescens]|uniref:Ribonuclease P protein component n=1 Tax=Allonocardiopsis opalescens TaxID=1144618 RepID=A0A2T0Q782_9ACTN|nr:ribonuclease P protein component [Allonocardiopsis opalescens]PRX99573.1 ribonuclease P protein component [Allonocardiopsis opalescens]
MLPRGSRIRRSADFTSVLRRGRRAGRPALVVHLLPPDPPGGTAPEQAPASDASPDASPTRAGFVVSRAVGGAVVRNRVRRRLRHLVRERLPLLPPGSLLVVRANPAAATTHYQELAVQLDSALDRLARPGAGTGGARTGRSGRAPQPRSRRHSEAG